MDIITQSLLGAGLATSVARKAEIKKAAIIGGLSGLLADADVLIQSSTDGLLTLEYHRHFTHSLIFIPIGALLATLLLWPFFRKQLPLLRIYLFALLGYSLSGVLDACTSYGTHLLWPFSDERIAWHIISIVDPIFTVLLLIAVIMAWRRQSNRAARFGLVLAAMYLVVGVVQLQRAESVAMALAQSRGHQPQRLVVKPTLANLVLWRSIYQVDDRYYIDAVRVGLGSHDTYEGRSIAAFDVAMLHYSKPIEVTSVLYRDIERFKRFSDGYIALHPQRDDIIGDIRYAMLPTSVSPLWGIEFDIHKPQQHVDFRFYREMSQRDREVFLRMLLGKQLN